MRAGDVAGGGGRNEKILIRIGRLSVDPSVSPSCPPLSSRPQSTWCTLPAQVLWHRCTAIHLLSYLHVDTNRNLSVAGKAFLTESS